MAIDLKNKQPKVNNFMNVPGSGTRPAGGANAKSFSGVTKSSPRGLAANSPKGIAAKSPRGLPMKSPRQPLGAAANRPGTALGSKTPAANFYKKSL